MRYAGTDIPLVETVSKRYIQATKGLPQRQEDFEERSLTAGPDNVKKWTRQAESAELERRAKVEAMDIYLAEQLKGVRVACKAVF